MQTVSSLCLLLPVNKEAVNRKKEQCTWHTKLVLHCVCVYWVWEEWGGGGGGGGGGINIFDTALKNLATNK